ncbi:peptidylprolyl isomerase [Hydrogenovibrio halophilus]|uniref:peptidylprolyl isomerase n=1 Tax=Hydrogenovibrio halophilus TaxID=373391 RepID=UPI00035CF4C2|nr:peptidylprolyl isomerase [Hydrogenovibrio halophilus]
MTQSTASELQPRNAFSTTRPTSRRWLSAVLTSLSLAWMMPGPVAAQTPNAQLLDQIIAVVNDDIILQSELAQRVRQAEQELRGQNIRIPDQDELVEKVLDQMVMQRLQMQRVKQLGLRASDQEVFERMQQIASRNNLTLDQLRDNLNRQQSDGFTQFREQIREQLLFQKLQETEVLARTQVTESEVDRYLQRQALTDTAYEYRLRHLLVSLSEGPTAEQRDEARQKIERLRQQVTDGQSFQSVAAKASDGQKALQGGDLGWLTQDQIPTFFSAVATQLQPGEVSDVIRSPVGYHLIKLEDKRRTDEKALVDEYRLHRFLLLSQDAEKASEPPQSLVDLSESIDSIHAFEALKTEYSDMPESTNARSDLGWQTLDDMSVTHARLIEQLSPGEAARPYATDEGWVILYLDQQRQRDPAEQDKRKQATETLRRQKANESFDVWLRRMKDQAIIDIRLDKLRTSEDASDS